MRTNQRNQLFDQIRTGGLDSALFIPTQPTEDRFLIRLAVRPLEFETRASKRSFDRFMYRYRIFVPGYPYDHPWLIRKWFPSFASESTSDAHWIGPVSFSRIKEVFLDWLTRHVNPAIEDATAPDLWLLAPHPFTFAGRPGRDEAEKISEPEAQQLRIGVQKFRRGVIHSFAPTPRQMVHIDERLAYLVKAIDRLNRVDWTAVAAATIVNIATTLSLDTTRGRQLWAIFTEAVAVVAGLLSP